MHRCIYLKQVNDFVSDWLYPQTCRKECNVCKHLQQDTDRHIDTHRNTYTQKYTRRYSHDLLAGHVMLWHVSRYTKTITVLCESKWLLACSKIKWQSHCYKDIQELIRRWDSERELLYDDNIHVEASAYTHWTDLLISTFHYRYLW